MKIKEQVDSRITFVLPKNLRKNFIKDCKDHNVSMSEVFRRAYVRGLTLKEAMVVEG